MPMQNKQVWVIKNQAGNFVNIRETSQGYYHTLYSGIPVDGKGSFKYYANEDTVKKYLEMLGQEFHHEYINIDDIPNGARIHTE